MEEKYSKMKRSFTGEENEVRGLPLRASSLGEKTTEKTH